METGQVKVNFIDDVGQILLIWVSTFGAKEMVQLLFSKGADVNKD